MFLRWTRQLTPLPDGLDSVFTEVDARGRVAREIGVDRDGAVVYRKPSDHPKWGRDGVFYLIDLPAPADEVDESSFEGLWASE